MNAPSLLTRRGFLDRGLRLALGASAAAALNTPAFLRRAVAAGAVPPGTRKLLFIFLRGGNDSVNTVIPWGDDAYAPRHRPTLHLPAPDPQSVTPGQMPVDSDPTRVIDLGNGFAGVHPALRDLAPLYNAGELAVVHRVGYPKQSRSHFDSQRYWENGTPHDDFNSTGVLYRTMVETGLHEGRTFPAVSVQRTPPLILRGPVAFPSLSDPERYDLLGVADDGADKAKLLAAITAAHREPHPAKDNRELLYGTGGTLQNSIETLKAVGVDQNDFFDTDGTTHLFPIDRESNQKGFPSSAYRFFRYLKVATQILAGTDAVIAGTQLTGFDTHNRQGALDGKHAGLLARLGWALYAVRRFLLDADPALWRDTVVVTLSEFGRTSKENGSNGTDHAEAGAMFVAGGGIAGGVYQCDNDSWTVGDEGSLFAVKGRYLGRAVDYRSVLGELIRKHLGATEAQLTRIIPGYADPAEHLREGGDAPDGTPIVGELNLRG